MRICTRAGAIPGLLAALLVGPAPASARQAPAVPQSPVTRAPVPGAPGGTRLLFGPTGRMLDPGRGYFSLDSLVLLSVNVGVTEWFSLGGGLVPVSGGHGSAPPFWVIPKFRILARGQTSVALCVAHAILSGDDQLGIAYVVGTRGTDDRSLTLGGAVAYLSHHGDDDDESGAGGALLVGGSSRLNEKWSVVTENYLTTGGGVLTFGVRLDRRSFVANVMGVAFFDFGDGVFVVPTVSLGWKF